MTQEEKMTDVNQAILDLAYRWKFNGDLMTCKCCGYSIIASRIHEQPRHADGCKNSDDKNPWAEMQSALHHASAARAGGMKIEEIYTALDRLESKLWDKTKGSRDVARKAYINGDKRKHDKFNAVARVYSMIGSDLGPLALELLSHTPSEFQKNLFDKDIPF